MTRFKEMSKGDKIYRLINYLFSFLMFTITTVLFVKMLLDKEASSTLKVRMLGPMSIILAIYLIEFILRFRVSNSVLLFYNIYVFFASFLGTAFSFYARISFYDDIMHTLFGYVGCVVGLYLLIKMSDYKKMSIPFAMVMMFFVSMGCGAVWEIIEFACDTWFGAQCQGSGIQDTMGDIVNNFIGALVFETHYLLYRLTKKNLLVGNVVEEFLNK